jgi:hypothetical protein
MKVKFLFLNTDFAKFSVCLWISCDALNRHDRLVYPCLQIA